MKKRNGIDLRILIEICVCILSIIFIALNYQWINSIKVVDNNNIIKSLIFIGMLFIFITTAVGSLVIFMWDIHKYIKRVDNKILLLMSIIPLGGGISGKDK